MALVELNLSSRAGTGLADPRTFYVIAGRGFAAILNHTVLLHGESRIGGRPVLHIGEPDPWRHRKQMEMGQWPHLLLLPGFARYPGFRVHAAEKFLLSKSFAAYLASEEHKLCGEFLSGRIVRVERRREQYTITVAQAGAEFQILADRIDLCSGAGPVTLLGPDVVREESLWAEYTGSPGPAQPWRRVVSGEDFLRDGALHPSHGSVCVYGGGGTAAWCVEVALAAGNEVLWVCRASLSGAFVPSGRNGHLGYFERGDAPHWKVGAVSPRQTETMSMAERYEITGVSSRGEKVAIRFTPRLQERALPRYVSAGGADRGVLDEVQCDQLVVAIGQSANGPGSMVEVFREFVPASLPWKRAKEHALFAPCGRLAGLKSRDNAIRFLGVAADVHPLTEVLCRNKGVLQGRDRYRRFLCSQARPWSEDGSDAGPALIPVAANDIAEANGLGCADLNRNLNTMSPGQLRRYLISERNLPRETAGEIEDGVLAERRNRVRPYVRIPWQWAEHGFTLQHSPGGSAGRGQIEFHADAD